MHSLVTDEVATSKPPSVRLPNASRFSGNTQIAFVVGTVINVFGPNGSNIYYWPQKRLLDAENGGSHARVNNAAAISCGPKILHRLTMTYFTRCMRPPLTTSHCRSDVNEIAS